MAVTRSPLEHFLAELDARQLDGNRPEAAQVVAAIVALEPRQAEAMCLVLWALPVEAVRLIPLERLGRRSGYSQRETARAMGIRQQTVEALLKRARVNIAAWLSVFQ